LVSFTEKWFIRKLKERDPDTFKELVLKHEKPIFNLLFRLTGTREEAEDLAQEVFITVFRKIGLFREEASIGTWIYQIALNSFRNRHKVLKRTRKRELHVEQIDAEQGSSQDSSIGSSRPDQLLEGFEMERLIQHAILDLDEDHRTIIVLRDIQNMSYQEICSITGLAEGTVKSRLHRARMTLKERISSHMR
jgi:RNA polymerase sigma-70 factor (ECF subfamily)